MADIADDTECAREGCAHLASAHEDTDAGDNTGACTMANCDCEAMVVADDAADGADGAPQGDEAAAARGVELATLGDLGAGARLEVGDDGAVRLYNSGGELVFSTAGDGETFAPEATAVSPPVDGDLGAQEVRFSIPVGILEEVDTGDGRRIQADALTWRELPISLKAVTTTGFGHDGAELVGRCDSVERYDASGLIDPKTGAAYGAGVQALRASGVFTTLENAQLIAGLIRDGFLRGISADLSDVVSIIEVLDEGGEVVPDDDVDMDDLFFGDIRETVTSGRVMAFTVCDMPAFEGCYIEIDDETRTPVGDQAAASAEGRRAASINVVDRFGQRECDTCADGLPLVASAGPLSPPRAWFDDPQLDEVTPLTITEDGRVYGHLATWGACHTGIQGRCVTPPRSMTNYGYFRTGALETAEGDLVSVGQITLDTGHAPLSASAQETLAHYDNTGTAVADIAAGEDRFGIWVSGAMRPDVTPLQVRKLRAAGLSGDWRQIGSSLELLGALAVNVQGFPTVRSLAASGATRALVAAGGRGVLRASHADRDRLRELERFRLAAEPVLLDMAAERLRGRVHGR